MAKSTPTIEEMKRSIAIAFTIAGACSTLLDDHKDDDPMSKEDQALWEVASGGLILAAGNIHDFWISEKKWGLDDTMRAISLFYCVAIHAADVIENNIAGSAPAADAEALRSAASNLLDMVYAWFRREANRAEPEKGEG